ncbi:hypothetical protein Tco_0733628 [Tanacetum coccineum]
MQTKRTCYQNCPMKKPFEWIKKNGNKSETEKAKNEVLMASKPSVSIKYPKSIHFETKCMLKGTDQEKFIANKLDDQKKFLFTYGLGEVVINNGDKGYLIPGVSYAPEVTLNILSLELLEKQGFDIMYENNTCSLVYMFKDPKGQSFNEDKLRIMHNKHLEEYFESLDRCTEQNKPVGLVSMEDDVIEIKGTLYSTRVTTFNEYVGFLNLVKQDEIVSQEWTNHKQFGTIGEILGLSKQNGEEIKRCYINYLDVFTSYYKTARVSTRNVEKGNGVNCLTSHQSDIAEIRTPNVEAAKGKEKMDHFGIELEDTSYESDNLSPIHPSIKGRQIMSKDNQGVIKGPIKLESEVKEDSNSSSSEDFTIVA